MGGQAARSAEADGFRAYPLRVLSAKLAPHGHIRGHVRAVDPVAQGQNH